MSREQLPTILNRFWMRSVWALALVAVCLGSDVRADGRTSTFRLRVDWAGDTAALWRGRLTISQGQFDQPQSLGTGRDDAGTITVGPQSVTVRRRSARLRDGFEIRVTASPETRLEFELGDEWSDRPPLKIQNALSEILEKPRVLAAEADRPRVVISRAPGDALAVTFDRSHLVFDPEESFRIVVGINPIDLRDGHDRSGKLTLKWKLLPAKGGLPLTDGSTTVSVVRNVPHPVELPIELQLPREEGVYNLRLALSGRGIDDVDRDVQLVVINPAPAKAPASVGRSEKLVDSFEPRSAGPFRKVTLHSLRQRHERALSRILNGRRRDEIDRIIADKPDGSRAFYKLHVARPGHPHRLDVHLPAGAGGTAFVGILQFDAQGKLERAAPDVQLSLAAPQPGAGFRPAESVEEARICRQIFWPQDREATLVISSSGQGQDPGQPIEPARVELHELGDNLATGQRAIDAPAGAPRKRLVGSYLRKPALAENFGSPQEFDATARTNLDDWQTFLLAGRRLTELAQYQQQAALMLAVFAEGTTLYPSRLVDSSLQYDSGRMASNGQDPVQKDVLELLLRLADRAGLAVVAELQFDAPLAAIERLRSEHGEAPEGLELVDRQGRSYVEAHEESAAATPGYNVFSPRVQEAVLNVVAELLERYKGHPSLAGVALELGPQSYLQLPGLEWGYDRETIGRFEQAAQFPVLHDGNTWRPDAHQLLTTTARREWVRFRCTEVGRFHRKLTELVTAALPAGRVIFSGNLPPVGDLGSQAEIPDIVRAGTTAAQRLQNQGLNFSQPPYAADGKVIVLRPIVQSAWPDRLGLAALATFNDSPAIDALYRSSSRGGLLFSVPTGNSPLVPAEGAIRQGFTGETAQVHVSAAAAERNYVHLLAAHDAQVIFDGGETIALNADGPAARLRRTIAHLPDVPFHNAGPQVQPAVIRTAQFGKATYLYAVNDSSLAFRIEVVLNCPSTTTCRSLENGKDLTLESGPDDRKCRLVVETGGHGMTACRFDLPGVTVADTKLIMPADVLARVHQRIEALSTKISPTIKLARADSPSPGLGADEVRQLTKTLASVKLAWEEERYADCQRLLDGYWGQLLMPEPMARQAPVTAPTRIGNRVRNALKR